MHPYLEMLRQGAEEKGSLLCFGMDPVDQRMRIDRREGLGGQIEGYFSRILDRIQDRITAVKPNLGYYLQYGSEGLGALTGLIRRARSRGLPVIIDAKLGDIGRSSEAYARFVFQVLGGNAVTLNPYLGQDSLQPFFSHQNKGHYVLALTSNPGARTFQLERMKPLACSLYEYVLKTICCWNSECPSVGAVLGATHSAFAACIDLLVSSRCTIPLLVPGVGAQGGSYGEVRRILQEKGYPEEVVRINASSSISYAHERFPSVPEEEAASRAVDELLSG